MSAPDSVGCSLEEKLVQAIDKGRGHLCVPISDAALLALAEQAPVVSRYGTILYFQNLNVKHPFLST